MKKYTVDMTKDAAVKYYFIRNQETLEIAMFPSKYLTHKTKSMVSPNTIRRCAFSLCCYMNYIDGQNLEFPEIFGLSYEHQQEHFINFLLWLRAGGHTEQGDKKLPNNETCNAYLKDVFRFLNFTGAEHEQFGSLKVLSYKQLSVTNAVGVQKTMRYQSFKGYLDEQPKRGRSIEHEKIIPLLEACTNCRDQLLLLCLAETGFRIGEILGIHYDKDIDYTNHMIGVYFRADNENDARAKNAEYRKAKISKDTFEILMFYIVEYRDFLQHQEYLFINIAGDSAGQPLKVDSVYDMLRRLEKKTGIKATPHMLRHYFANMRRKEGWRLELISQALGHQNIETTVRYLDILSDDLTEASEEFYRKHQGIYGASRLF